MALARLASQPVSVSVSVSVTWHLRVAGAPAVLRDCPRCDERRRFVSSGRFRVNASGRRLDVWLIHRCAACDFTWNRTVHERVTPAELGALLPRYERNDEALAHAVACDVGGLEVAAPAEVDLVVDRPAIAPGVALEITLRVAPGAALRLERLLARELGWSRSQLTSAAADGGITISPGGVAALRRPARDGARIRIRLEPRTQPTPE
ncbi:MAG: DUF1062 domain-containing protein [Deltaproteobacteria bacterium]|nr:DUF1062 domain-containing protein [Deltaproteobacteria bacterium]